MSKLPSAEESLKYQFHIIYDGLHGKQKYYSKPEALEAIHTYSKAVADELASRIKENENSVEFDLWLDSIVEQLKKEIAQ